MLLPAVIFIVIFKLQPTNIIITKQVKPAVGISFFLIGTTICLHWPTFLPIGYLLYWKILGFQGSSQSIPVVPTIPSYIMNALVNRSGSPL